MSRSENSMEKHEEAIANNKDEVASVNYKSTEVNYMGLKAMPYIIGNETFEKLGTLGTSANLLIYLTSIFKMKAITATIIITVWQGTASFGTLVGAFLSDAYFGRYKTIGFATAASFLGLTAIALTAAVKQLHPPHCETTEAACVGPTPWQMAFLLSGFGLMTVGAAGIRPCNMAFGADQFDSHTETGKKGIRIFFSWYFLTYTFAQAISLTAIVYVQSDVSWAIGLGIPAGLMLIACVLFYKGSNIYVKVKPNGSPVTSVLQVLVLAARKRKLQLPEHWWSSMFNYIPHGSLNSRLPHTDQFRFLDKAAIITSADHINPDGSANSWKLSSIQQVEEVKCLLRILPVWASGILYNIAVIQQNTYAIFQALQSDRHITSHFEIPAASYVIFIQLSLTLCLATYDRILVPLVQRLTGNKVTLLQKIGSGIFLSIPMMLVSALVEQKRRTIAIKFKTIGHIPIKGSISSMSAFWLIPQMTLTGLAEALAIVGQIEFYYNQFPENMRSIAGSVFYCGMAISSYLNSLLISIVHSSRKTQDWLPEDLNRGRLDYFYYLVAAMATLNFVIFLVVSKWYKYKGDGSDELEGVKDKQNLQAL